MKIYSGLIIKLVWENIKYYKSIVIFNAFKVFSYEIKPKILESIKLNLSSIKCNDIEIKLSLINIDWEFNLLFLIS